jgi:hypothetical protein
VAGTEEAVERTAGTAALPGWVAAAVTFLS